MSETFNYTLASSLLSATNFTGSNLSISGNMSASNIALSGNLSVSGTLNTVNMTTTNLIDTNVSAGNANISNMTIGNVKVTSNLSVAGQANALGTTFVTTTSGSIGIGTGSPRSTLEVYGNARIINNLMISTAANNNLGINLPTAGYGIHWGTGYSRIYDDGDLRICTDDNMHFYTGSTTSSPGTERITLRSDGKLGIGTNSPNYTLAVNGPAQFGNNTLNNKIIVLWDLNSSENWTSGTSFFGFGINNGTLRYQVNAATDNHKFYFGSNLRARVGGSGQTAAVLPAFDGNNAGDWPAGWGGGLSAYDITCSGITAVYGFTQRSDIRKKQDITDYTRGLNEILQMRPVSFTWKANPEYGTQYGFIAQEMEQIIPEIVNEDTAGFKSIENAFNPIFTNAIQELKQKLDSVRAKIDQLNNKKTL